jgi:hypothetical protein
MIIPLTISITIYFVVALFFWYIIDTCRNELDIPADLDRVIPFMVIIWPITFVVYFLIKNKVI